MSTIYRGDHANGRRVIETAQHVGVQGLNVSRSRERRAFGHRHGSNGDGVGDCFNTEFRKERAGNGAQRHSCCGFARGCPF